VETFLSPQIAGLGVHGPKPDFPSTTNTGYGRRDTADSNASLCALCALCVSAVKKHSPQKIQRTQRLNLAQNPADADLLWSGLRDGHGSIMSSVHRRRLVILLFIALIGLGSSTFGDDTWRLSGFTLARVSSAPATGARSD
jgi:hypothetical protein